MQKIQALVCDLDGSLLNHFKDVSPASQDLLVQIAATGCFVGLASGRSADQILKDLKRWGLDGAVSFVIGSNGCSMVNRLLNESDDHGFLNYADYQRVCKALEAFPVSCGVMADHQLYFNKPSFYSAIYCLVAHTLPHYQDLEALANAQFPKVYITGTPKDLKKIHETVHIDGMQLVPVGRYSLEAVRQGVSKFNTLQSICGQLGIDPANALTFGDDFNDIEMLENTIGVALKNSPEEVLRAARQVTKYPASQDGIAYHLNELLLSKDYEFIGIDQQAGQ